MTVLETQPCRQCRAADHAGGRATLDDAGREGAGKLGGGEAAVRLHQMQRCGDPQRPQPRRQRRQIFPHHRLDISVHNSRAGAWIFLYLRQDLVTHRQRHFGKGGADGVGQQLFMGGIGVAVQQADRDAAHILPAQHVDGGGDGMGVERRRDAAVGAGLLPHLKPQPPLHQRRRLGPVHVVEPGHAEVANFQHVAKAVGGDQRHSRALAFKNGVGRDRGGVEHFPYRAGADHVRSVEQRFQPGGDAPAVIARRRRRLVGAHRSVRTDRHEIGESAADIDADTKRHGATSCSGCQPTTGGGGRVLRNRRRNASVAGTSIIGGSPCATTP